MRTTALASAAWLPLLVSALAVQAQTVAPAANSAQPLALVQGQQQLFKPGIAIARIAIGDPAVLDVQVLGELPQTGKPAAGKAAGQRPARHAELLLTPKAAGSTTFMVWPSQGEPQTWNVVVSGPRLLLERRLQSLPEHARASTELAAMAPKGTPLADLSQVDVRSNTVQVDVQVVEFKKSAMRRAGVQLNSGGANDHGFQFGVYTPGSNGSSSGSSNSGNDNGTSAIASAMNLVLGFGRAFSGRGITAQLGFLEGNGLARVLAKPTLVAQSGQTASFLAGGEIPIPVPSGGSNSISIQFKEFGVKLQLTPTILSNERIALKVAPEASDLDYTQGVTINDISVPALRTRRADTFVELADGESFIVGGLVSRSTLSNVNKVPLLGDLPILGTFFKNLDYSQEETELVIIVTPRLVQPLPAGTNLEALLPGAQQERPNAAGVWAPYAVGAPYANSPLPGFSY